MSTNQVKVTYKSETKKFRKPADFEGLLQQTIKAFGQSLPQQFKFYYVDSDGDLISISCQEDLEEAMSMPNLKLVVEESIEAARFNLEPDFSMRSSNINMPMMSPATMSNQHYAEEQQRDKRVSHEFEDVMYEEAKSQPSYSMASVSVGNYNPNTEKSTDVRQLVDFQNFACNTNVQTDEKELNATVPTSEMGSQIRTDVKEAACDGSVQTVSRSSQINFEGKIPSEQIEMAKNDKKEESIEEDNSIVCFRCDGTQVNRKGLPCRRCNGTGHLNNKFFSELMKVLRTEIQGYTTQTFQRLMVDYLGKRATDQANVFHEKVECDGCGVAPIQGIRYKCSVCPNFDFCDKCEIEKTHAHPFLKIRRPDQAPAFIACTYQNESEQPKAQAPASPIKRKTTEKKILYSARFVKENFGDRQKVKPNEIIYKVWTFRNNGEQDWPEETYFIQTNGDDLGAQPLLVPGPVKPGQEIDVQLQMVAPTLPGKYCSFFRFVYGDNQRFGQKVWCDILVEEQPQIFEQAEPEIKQSQEQSPLLNMSEQRVSSLISDEQDQQISSLQFENIDQKYEELAKVMEGSFKVQEPLVEEKVAEVEPLIKLGESKSDEPLIDLQKQEPEEEKQEEPVVEQEPELSDEEKLRKQYLQELQSLNLTDKALVENLEYMMNMGYLNFRVNLNLLKRNNNDLVIAINKLCNNMVSESIFLAE